MHISADMKVAIDFLSTSETSTCGSRRKDSHPPPCHLPLEPFISNVHPS